MLLLSLAWKELVASSEQMRKTDMGKNKKITYGMVAFLVLVPVPMDIIANTIGPYVLSAVVKYVRIGILSSQHYVIYNINFKHNFESHFMCDNAQSRYVLSCFYLQDHFHVWNNWIDGCWDGIPGQTNEDATKGCGR